MEDKRGSILVVDDDVVFLKQADELLGEEFSVSLAKSPGQALRLLQGGFLPDLILLDVDMPEMNGYEVLESIRRLEGAEQVPVIFVTGMAGEPEEVKGIEAGAVDYITKPFHRSVLFARLHRHLETARRERELRLERQESTLRINRDKLEAIAALLTETELKVARCIALGHTNREIARELNYSYAYVKKVAGEVYDKAGVGRRSELRQMLTEDDGEQGP